MQISTSVVPPGLRERKKQRTRQAIREAALALYEERGYEGVTVAEIARRADVAPRTFFGYFASKEDVFLEPGDARLERVVRAIRERAPGVPILAAVREELQRSREPQREVHALARPHVAELLGQPAIVERLRERWNRWEDQLSAAIAAEVGSPPGDPEPRVLAAVVTAAIRIAAEAAARRTSGREEVAGRVFDLIASGLAGYGA